MSAAPDRVPVEIVIDNYEYADYVAAAIESALAQTHPATRVIVVDDGSRDSSRAVLEDYRDRVELVLKENGGQASALNAGFERCTGEVVIFLDADDLLHPEAASRAAAALSALPTASKAQTRMDVVDASGRPNGELKPPPRLPMPSGDLRAAELAHPFDLAWLPTSANAFRRETLAAIMPIPEAEYPINADWYLVHLTTLLGETVAIPEVGASYRVHGANNYEPQSAEIDLDHVRTTVVYAERTARALIALAARRGEPHPTEILSVSDLGQRLISLRLEPAKHPRRRATPGSGSCAARSARCAGATTSRPRSASPSSPGSRRWWRRPAPSPAPSPPGSSSPRAASA